MVSSGRQARPDHIQYADSVADTRDNDPLFIVPAVVPDDDQPDHLDPVETSPAPTPVAKTASVPRTTVVTPKITAPVVEPAPAGAGVVAPTSSRRVTRTIRHVDPFSIFKVALVFHFVLYLTLLLAGVLLWNVANATGTVDNIERFMESFGWDTFQFKGGELFHQAWILGLFGVVGLTGVAVLAATTFNLITDLVGGVRVTVLENDQPG